MHFDYIPKKNASYKLGYIDFEEKFYRFVDEYNIVGVEWSQPTSISASYFFRLLTEGSSARARGYGRGRQENDEHSRQLMHYYSPLFDHGAMWKLNDGRVICTAMPYGTMDSIMSAFHDLISEFDFLEEIRYEFLENKFKYRENGDYMIIMYYDNSPEQFNPYCSDQELYRRAIKSSRKETIRTSSYASPYVRNQYIKAYAKRRANGVCQLCRKPAPFFDANGDPFLEIHHVIWLGKGGEDSIDNTVALCPDCHRKMHVLDLEEDVQKLLNIARQRI